MKPFRRTLVVKLLGRQLSYGFMLKKLRQLWERKGSIEVFDCENHFYLVNFQHMDDYMEALVGGPWVIADAYLNVARWRPDFNPKNERIESVVAWVRLPDLPAPLFDKKFLLNLGNSIGKAIRLDVHTAKRARGKFARMCVELDLTKPLVPEFNVEGQMLSVEYESLGPLCSRCGRVGHNHHGCEDFHKKCNESGMDIEEKGEQMVKENDNGDEGGKWKSVQRGRRQRKSIPGAQGMSGGSRFSVLNGETENENQAMGEENIQQEMVCEGSIKGAKKEVSFKQKKKPERSVNGGGGNKGMENAGPSGVEKSVKEEQKERAEKVKKGPVKTQSGLVCNNRWEKQVGDGNPEYATESIMNMQQGLRLSMVDKENIHPGENGAAMSTLESMDTGEIQNTKNPEVLVEKLGVNMEGVCRTPTLAD
ncbi:hypothetical protein K1719_018363 [Acacia pycnantha]|nr:hypothetical protein K1719_018363 [Acacia pycnantha]